MCTAHQKVTGNQNQVNEEKKSREKPKRRKNAWSNKELTDQRKPNAGQRKDERKAKKKAGEASFVSLMPLSDKKSGKEHQIAEGLKPEVKEDDVKKNLGASHTDSFQPGEEGTKKLTDEEEVDTDEQDVVAIETKKKECDKELEITQAETKMREAERVQPVVDSLAREEEWSKLNLYELTTHR